MKAVAFILLIFALLLSACGPTAEQKAILTGVAVSQTVAAYTTTPSVTPPPTATATPTPAPTSTPTPAPTATVDPNLYVAPDKTFSLVPPTGWVKKSADATYPMLEGPKADGFAPNMTFMVDTSSLPGAFYAAMMEEEFKADLEGFVDMGQTTAKTNAGKEYLRWEIEHVLGGKVYHQIFYLFESGDWKLVMAYTRLKSHGSAPDVLVEAAIKTVKIMK